MVIILLGCPGSGKGTISSFLKEKYNFIHISTGNLFRKEIDKKTTLGYKLKQIMLSGNLVSDEITNEVVRQEIFKYDLAKTSLVFDGYPRNVDQLIFLTNLVKIDFAIDITVSEEEIIKRITGRRICPICNEIYNIYYKKPKQQNICDKDGSLLLQRNDDQQKIVKQRYKTYLKLNKPLIDKCQSLKIYNSITNNTIEDAIKQLCLICQLK